MGERRTALRDVKTVEEFRRMLRTAASIDEKEKSLTLFFFLIVTGRLGLRIGEAIHMTEDWYDPERNVISIQPKEPCNCGLCEHNARVYAKRHDLDFEEVFANYWRVKDGSDRDVYVPTRRDRRIIERYFEEVPYTSISYGTADNRIKRLAELMDGIRPETVYFHAFRATAATHLLWSGVRPAALDVQLGWQDEKTKEKYAQRTGLRTMQEFDRVYNREPDTPIEVREDPPTWVELRPSNAEDRIFVERWTPESEIEPHPHGRDFEDALLNEFEDEDGDMPPLGAVTPTGAAVSLAAQGGGALQRRARVEERAMAENPDMADLTASHAASVVGMSLVPALALVTAIALGDGPTAAAGMLLGAGYGVWDIDL